MILSNIYFIIRAINFFFFIIYYKNLTFCRQNKYYAVTYLCPTSARRLFPCWDEPSLKATFTIQLVLPRDMSLVGLSNMVSNDWHF